jgi:hypothetical protein
LPWAKAKEKQRREEGGERREKGDGRREREEREGRPPTKKFSAVCQRKKRPKFIRKPIKPTKKQRQKL